jgi:hypothetical protein
VIVCVIVSTSAYKLDYFDSVAVCQLYCVKIAAADDPAVQFDGDAGCVEALLRQQLSQRDPGSVADVLTVDLHKGALLRQRKIKKASQKATPVVVYPFVTPCGFTLFLA